MNYDESLFSLSERIIISLKQLYYKSGYAPYKMSKFEEYDLYAKNKSFLVSDNVITFTDVSGKLMALKPDVTLSIIKNCKDLPNETQKVFYAENVYRVSKKSEGYKEIMQTGLECFGKVDLNSVLEVLNLAMQSLELINKNYVLAISDLNVIEKTVSSFNLEGTLQDKLYKAISEKNLHEITDICPMGKERDFLCELLSVCGNASNALLKLVELKDKYGMAEDLNSLLEIIKNLPEKDFVSVDFSILNDINYYNGIVFKGYISGLPDAVLSGGQYDKLMKKMSHESKAIGFAVYTDSIERIPETNGESDGFINVALPKGRLGEKVYSVFAEAGLECPSILEPNRKLIFENAENKIRYFWVKPSDVAIYVERGAADVGVAGKDILLEYNPDVYELLDLNMGKCRMAVASKKNFKDDASKTLRVATKFAAITKDYYMSKGRDIDIIHLNGSIELAPILGLSDVIVDIVETGATLKENDLEVVENIVPISARFVSNKSAYKFKEKRIAEIVKKISAVIGEKND